MAQIILARKNGEPLDMILYCEVMYDIENNISGETPEHREFIYNKAIPLLKSWGYNVTIVRSHIDYKNCFYRVLKNSKVAERNGKFYGFPLPGKCIINRDCKVGPIEKFCNTNKINSKTAIQYIGIAKDEKARLERLKGTNKVSLLEKYDYTEDMARELCVKYDLLSPAYEFTARGGCWFCPNCKDREFEHMRKYHPELWYDLVKLGDVKNVVSPLFNRRETIQDIEERLMWGEAQMNIERDFPEWV